MALEFIPQSKTEYKNYEDGEYTATGIQFTSVDPDGNPILKQQKNGMVTRFMFQLTPHYRSNLLHQVFPPQFYLV